VLLEASYALRTHVVEQWCKLNASNDHVMGAERDAYLLVITLGIEKLIPWEDKRFTQQ
jgi:hypothetical protein